MNQKELAELRRRFRAEKSDMVRIRGCFVNENREIVSSFCQNIGMLSLAESEAVLGMLRKTITGVIGKRLIDVAFTNEQVMDSDEHRLLMALRQSGLEDDAIMDAFYARVLPSIELKGNFLLLTAFDTYGVPVYHKDGEKSEDANEEFSFLVSCVCPVKPAKPQLGYSVRDGQFRSMQADNTIGAPEFGFLFPSFDDRTANIYNALFYTRSLTESHASFVSALFNSTLPMPAAIQKETFDAMLSETVSEDCSLEVVQAVREQLNECIEAQKIDNEADAPTVSKADVASALSACGVSKERIAAFSERFDEAFGADATLVPQNILDSKRLEVKTPDISIKVTTDRNDLVEARRVDGRRCILIHAEESVEVNGVSIRIP